MPTPKMNDAEIREAILDCLRSGLSLRKTADQVGCAPKSIRNWRKNTEGFDAQVQAAVSAARTMRARGQKPAHDIVFPGIIIEGSRPAPRSREEAYARLDSLLWSIAESPDHKSNGIALTLLHKDLMGPGIAGRVAEQVMLGRAKPIPVLAPIEPEKPAHKPTVFIELPRNGTEGPRDGDVIDLEPVGEGSG